MWYWSWTCRCPSLITDSYVWEWKNLAYLYLSSFFVDSVSRSYDNVAHVLIHYNWRVVKSASLLMKCPLWKPGWKETVQADFRVLIRLFQGMTFPQCRRTLRQVRLIPGKCRKLHRSGISLVVHKERLSLIIMNISPTLNLHQTFVAK